MTDERRTKKGISLAKGPVALVGVTLLVYGITALIFGGHSFAQHAPTGEVYGKTWIGLEVNGWTGLLFVTSGLLLILGAPLHWGAKAMSLLVGVALVVVSLIALAGRHGAVGLFAANHLTELVWIAAGAVLIVLSRLPRVGGRTRRTRHHLDPEQHRPPSRPLDTGAQISERQPPAEPTHEADRQSDTRPDPANARDSAAPGLRTSAPATTSTIQPTSQEGSTMTNKHVDEGKGRMKEAAGSLTGDQSLKNEGKADQAKAKLKDAVDKVVDVLTSHKDK
jgi:uncharacterized protein YjbJ (UPF0337 family)